nr:uncharacterized protein LOC104652133 [Saimiri boliviensis boliviensis]
MGTMLVGVGPGNPRSSQHGKLPWASLHSVEDSSPHSRCAWLLPQSCCQEKQEINHRILSSAGNQRRTPFILQTCRVDPSRTSSPPPGLQPLRQVLVPPP